MINLTEKAAIKVNSFLTERGKGLGIKVGTKTVGCSGLAYVLEYVDQLNDWDPEIFESNGTKIYVDKKDLVYLDGLTMDWVKQGINEGFEFINPKEKSKCGCGESFNV